MDSIYVSNGHIDSLIKYVLDVKPYHTKLSEIVEEYSFSDSFSVTATESTQELAVLGLDYNNAANNPLLNVWDNVSVRPESSLSATRIIQAANRRLYSIPSTVIHKLFSESQFESHVISEDDTSQIPGLDMGVVDQRRFDGPGIPVVRVNDVAQIESLDYHVSHGAFSFEVADGSTWMPKAVDGISPFAPQDGVLAYNDVHRAHGYIVDITAPVDGNFEEWTLTWVAGDEHLLVVGSSSGLIGTAEFGVPFVHALINFTYVSSSDDDPTQQYIEDGQTFTLTPAAKISVHPDAVDETWTLIKVNPIAISEYSFDGESPNAALSIYTRALERTIASEWIIEFISPTEYEVQCVDNIVTGYPKTGSLLDGRSFKDDNLHFTIIGTDFVSGDNFQFTVTEHKPNYLVYGSVSGWSDPATIGKWYFNGSIGFKVPQLEYFAFTQGNTLMPAGITPLHPVHSIARPSAYKIHFRKDTSDTGSTNLVLTEDGDTIITEGGDQLVTIPTTGKATVFNNIYGYREGLIVGEAWKDEFCSFQIDGTFIEDDVIVVYLAPRDYLPYEGGYDEFPYDEQPYDVPVGEKIIPIDLLQEYFPLTHSHDTIIFMNPSDGDEVIIDKSTQESVRFRMGRGALDDPEILSELADDDGWIPLEFRNGSVFPDYVAVVEAYLGADKERKVFEIRQPAEDNGKPGLAVIEFEEDFFETFMQGKYFTLQFYQQATYNQTAAVKIVEHFDITWTNV
jgi:hypothetical protein